MSAKRKEINRITAVMKEHSEQLWTYPNVVGFGVGFKVKGGKKLDQLAIIVFVKKKVPRSDLQRHEVIPANIGGALTDVQESGEIIALPARTDKWRPAPPGVSIGHYLITAGTFGCVALKSGIRKILSNNHVLANCNAANIGDAIYQPGVYDGGGAGDTIALLEDWIPIVFSPVANNLIDVATAAPINDDDILNEILEIGIPTSVIEAELDMSVVKSGRTTAITYGTITAINATVSVGYGAFGTARFIDQIITTYMLAGGDSGSLLLTHPEHEAVGLCFAGSPSISIASHIQYAESLLGISIFTGVTDASVDLYAKFVVGQGSVDLLGKTEIMQLGSGDLPGKFSAQVSIDLLSKGIIKNASSAGLLGGFLVKHEATAELLGEFSAQTSVALLAKTLIRNEATAGLLGKTDIEHSTSVDILGKFTAERMGISLNFLGKAVIRNVGTSELLGKGVIRNIGSVELLGELAVRHVGTPVELFAKVNIAHFMDLLGKGVIRNIDDAGFLGKGAVRQSGFVELLAKIEIGYFEDLLAHFVVAQDSTDLLGKVDIQRPRYLDLLAKTRIRPLSRLWTNRRYLNGVVDLSETLLGNAILEYVIEGVMQDIQSYLINRNLDYSGWTDISLTPKLIKRATTYGTVAALYARKTGTIIARVIPTIAPVTVTAVGDEEGAMNHWRDKMNRALEYHVTSQRGRGVTSTEDEEAIFSMEDIPSEVSDYTPWYEWSRRRT